MAVDMFLKIEGIDGESLDQKHKGEIEISSFSWGVQNQGLAGGGTGGGTGKVSLQDFHFIAKVSKASPSLMLACATGEHFKKAVLSVRKAGTAGKGSFEYIKFWLEDVLVSGWQSSGHGGDTTVPGDEISFNFQKIEFIYTVQRSGEVVDAFFDFTPPAG